MSASKAPKVETKPQPLREAMMKRVHRRLVANGSVVLPGAPALLADYADMLAVQFQSLGRPFSRAELDHMKGLLGTKLEEAFRDSPYSRVRVEWRTNDPPAVSLSYFISILPSSIEAEYAEWTRSREPPYFGTHPDAKVVDVAASLGAPADVAILDVGAGTGRNALALSRLGYTVGAVERTPALARVLRAGIADEGLGIKLFEGNVLDAALGLPKAAYKLVFLSEVLYHFRELSEIRSLFRLLSEVLQPGGILLFSAFVAHDAYTPDKVARELAEVFWSTVQTRKELAEAMTDLPFERLSDEAVYAYERDHLPKEAWPPTGWFAEWTQGQDVFAVPEGKSPVDLRWVAYRRN